MVPRVRPRAGDFPLVQSPTRDDRLIVPRDVIREGLEHFTFDHEELAVLTGAKTRSRLDDFVQNGLQSFALGNGPEDGD